MRFKQFATVIACAASVVVTSACATSPLYRDDPSSGQGTVPRDELGEPIWDRVKPVPEQSH